MENPCPGIFLLFCYRFAFSLSELRKMQQKRTKTVGFLYFAVAQTLDKALKIYTMETNGVGI